MVCSLEGLWRNWQLILIFIENSFSPIRPISRLLHTRIYKIVEFEMIPVHRKSKSLCMSSVHVKGKHYESMITNFFNLNMMVLTLQLDDAICMKGWSSHIQLTSIGQWARETWDSIGVFLKHRCKRIRLIFAPDFHLWTYWKYFIYILFYLNSQLNISSA